MGFGPSSFVSPCNRWRRWPCQFIMRWPKSSVRTKISPSLSGHSLLWRSPDSLAAKQKNGDRGQTSHTTDMSWHVTTCHNQKVDLFFRPQNVLSHPVTSSCLVSAPTTNKWVSNPLNHGSGLFQRRIHLPMKICSTINVPFYTNSGTPENGDFSGNWDADTPVSPWTKCYKLEDNLGSQVKSSEIGQLEKSWCSMIEFSPYGSVSKPCTPGEHQNSW